MTKFRYCHAVWLSVVSAVGFSVAASAAGFSVREQSTEGQGAAFAGVAAGTNGLSALFWNPATSTQHEGLNSESNGALVLPYSRADDGVNDSGNIGVVAIVPASYATYQFNDLIYFGLALNSPFGLSTENDSNWVGAPHGTESDLLTINANPSVALKLSDQLSVGLGAQVEYMNANLEARESGSGNLLADIEGEDFGVGWTAGLIYAPTEATQIGLGFRSAVKHKLEGDATIRVPGPVFMDFNVNAPFTTPEIMTLGIRHSLSDRLTLLGGVEWTNWSRFETLQVFNNAGGGLLTSVTENWDDSWYFSVGGEYGFSDALMLRAGLAYEDSSVPDATRTPRVPDNDRYWISAGASYKLTDWATAHAAYTHIFIDDGIVNLPGLTATYKQHLNIVSGGLTINW